MRRMIQFLTALPEIRDMIAADTAQAAALTAMTMATVGVAAAGVSVAVWIPDTAEADIPEAVVPEATIPEADIPGADTAEADIPEAAILLHLHLPPMYLRVIRPIRSACGHIWDLPFCSAYHSQALSA